MFSKLKRLIAAPSFPNDEEKTRAAAQVYTIVLASLLSTIVYTLIWPIVTTAVIERLLFVLPLYPLLLGLLYLIRRGYILWANRLLIAGLWLFLLIVSIANGGVRASAFSGNIVVVLCAGILLGRRAALSVAVASIFSGFCLVLAERSNLISPPAPSASETTVWIAQAVYVIVAAVLLQLATRNIATALARARTELIERQHVEDSLKASEKRFRALIENSYDGLTLLDARGNIIYDSPANERISGFTNEERKGKNGLNLFHPADRKRLLRDFIETTQKPGSIKSSVYRIQHKDGSLRWVEGSAHNLINDPDVGAIIVNTHDVTERTQAESLQDAVYRIAQAADNIESLNDLYPRIHQIISEVMTAQNFFIAIYDTERDKLIFPYFRDEQDSVLVTDGISPARGLTAYVLRTGRSLLCTQAVHDELERQGEVKLLGSPSAIWLGVPLIVAAKTIGVMVVQDYSDPQAYGVREQRVMEFVSAQVATAIYRKQSEDALQQSEEQYRYLVEHSPYGVVVHVQGKVVYLNPTAMELIGAKGTEEVLGKPIMNFAHPDSSPAVIQRLTEGKEAPPLEAKFVCRDGKVIDVEATGFPFVFQNEPAVQVVFHDITERKQAESLQDAVYRIAQAADNIESLNDLYPRIHQIISEVMPAQNFYIAIYDAKRDKLIFPYSRDEEDNDSLTDGISPARGLTAYVLRTGRSLLCTQAVHDELERQGEVKLLGAPSAIWLGVPLIVAAKIIGVMVVQDYSNPQAYGVREQRVMEFVSVQVATAIYRKQAEDALQQSEEQYRYLVEHSPYGVVIHSQGIVTYLNPTAIKLIGAKNAAEVIGQRVMNFIHPNSPAAVIQRLTEINEGLETPPLEEKFMRFDGRAIDVEVTTHPLVYQNQNAIQVVFHDITERKRAEKQRMALFEIVQAVATTSDLNDLFQGIHQSLKKVVYAENCFITLYDQADRLFHEVFFIDRSDTVLPPHKLGKSVTAYVFRTGRSLLLTQERLQDLIAQGEVELLGTTSPSWLGVPLKTPTETIGVLAVQHHEDEQAYTERDVEFLQSVGGHIALAIERKRAEEVLRQRNKELALLNQAIHALSQILDPDQVLPAVIDEVRRLLDVQAGAIWLIDPASGLLICRHAFGPHSEFIRNQILPAGDNLLNGVMHSLQSWIINDKLLDSNPVIHTLHPGDPEWRSAVLVPLAGRQGAIGVLQVTDSRPDRFNLNDRALIESLADTAAIAIENTRLYAAEKQHTTELTRALDQQRELDRMKDEFIQNVSHEWRTPLSIAYGYAVMLDQGDLGEIQAEQREPIAIITRRLNMLRRMVEDVSAVLEVRTREPQREWLDVSQIVRQKALEFQPRAMQGQITLSATIDADPPALYFDSTQLHRILDNLISNALKFTPAGGRIGVELRHIDQALILKVADTGVGIPEDQLNRVFERFYQVHGGMARRYGGTGLGLALVKEIVEANQGSVKVESQLQRGTTFIVKLPLQMRARHNP